MTLAGFRFNGRMSTDSPRDPEAAVRAFYSAYSEGRPDLFDDVVGDDYLDYGHQPPGRGPQGARDDYEHARRVTGGLPTYDIDALVTDGDAVAVVWTGHLPDKSIFRGLSLYRVRDGKLRQTRHTSLGPRPSGS